MRTAALCCKKDDLNHRGEAHRGCTMFSLPLATSVQILQGRYGQKECVEGGDNLCVAT